MENGKKKKLKKIGLILAGIVVFYIVSSLVASVFIYRAIFKTHSPSGPAFELEYGMYEADYPRIPVTFKSGKYNIDGYLYEANGEKKGTIVYVNGMNANTETHLPEIFYLVDSGFDVFNYNATGTSESSGNNQIGLSKQREDFLAALDYLEEQGIDRVYALGHSAGGYAVASTADDERVISVVALAGFTSPVQMMNTFASRYVGVLADIQYPFMALQHFFLFGSDGFADPVETLNHTDKPVLVVQGTEDETVPMELSIFGVREKITGAHVAFFSQEDKHTTLHLTVEAEQYRDTVRAEYDEMAAENSGKVTPEMRATFNETIDKEKANDLDLEMMKKITDFLTESAE